MELIILISESSRCVKLGDVGRRIGARGDDKILGKKNIGIEKRQKRMEGVDNASRYLHNLSN